MAWYFWLLGLGPVVIIGGFIMLNRLSYRHPALIIREVGDSQVIIRDKFRTRPKSRDNEDLYIIEFMRQVKNKSLAPKYSMWTPFWIGKKPPELGHTMSRKELNKAMQQGGVFYQATTNEVKPVTIEKNGNLKVLDQDSRAFVVSEMQQKQDFMKSGQSKWAQVAMVVGPIFLMGVISLVMWIIFNTNMTENIASICGQASKAGGSAFVDAVQGVAG